LHLHQYKKPHPAKRIRQLQSAEIMTYTVSFRPNMQSRFPSPVLTGSGSKGWQNPLSEYRTPSVHGILISLENKINSLFGIDGF
jgi:hypothetical protein